jgi:tRNA threonylcarbamoyladenosine biosynthesis protein TsaB
LNILAIDTSTKIEIAAASSGNSFSEEIKAVSESHSVSLFENIDLVLKKIKLELKDINLMCVGIGPGSFTGIRIAVSTARMFAQIFNLPLVGIKTHLMYAVSVCDKAKSGDNILIAFDAKKSRVFGALYKKENDDLNPTEIVKPGDYSIEYILSHVKPGETTILAGDGSEKYFTDIKNRIERCDLLTDFLPSGKIICSLAEKIYLENPGEYGNLNKVLPFYARRSDAETMKGKI